MSLARKDDNNFEILATTGTVGCNSRDKIKQLTMTGNVTLNTPSGQLYPGDIYYYIIRQSTFTLTLAAGYTNSLTTPPTLLKNCMLLVWVNPDLSIEYTDIQNGA